MSAWGGPETKGLPMGSGNIPNQTKPNTDHTSGRGGVNRSRVEVATSRQTANATQRVPMREVYAKELAWAEQHLPEEYGPFVALAIESLKRRGVAPSTKSVLGHLSALGRDAASRGGV